RTTRCGFRLFALTATNYPIYWVRNRDKNLAPHPAALADVERMRPVSSLQSISDRFDKPSSINWSRAEKQSKRNLRQTIMAYASFSQFLAALEKANELIRVAIHVNTT